ncbi:hypothetical protein ACWEPM_16125 [Streptomyces sp. NPDC004244]|uniref:hypothetical protein n=1 Tax=Streptomyces sp. NPDC101206 TaxID=3366128 RepID=UPI0037FB9B1C
MEALLPFPELAAGCAADPVRLLPASAGVLAALGPAAGAAAAAALRAGAGAGDLAAATALAHVTGDAGPAVAMVRALPDPAARRRAGPSDDCVGQGGAEAVEDVVEDRGQQVLAPAEAGHAPGRVNRRARAADRPTLPA